MIHDLDTSELAKEGLAEYPANVPRSGYNIQDNPFFLIELFLLFVT